MSPNGELVVLFAALVAAGAIGGVIGFVAAVRMGWA